MTDELPLAAARERLEHKRGRPKKSAATMAPAARAKTVGRDTAHRAEGHPAQAAVGCIPPRLLDLKAAAAYLAVSSWTVRDLEASGVLRRVNIPVSAQKDLRKVLFDRQDLDRLVEAWKAG
ncbi:MAG: hypothetical protein ACREK9_15590 [Candidatus Rokuibacteriota bacterium]